MAPRHCIKSLTLKHHDCKSCYCDMEVRADTPTKNTVFVTDGSYCILALHSELCLLNIVLNHGHSNTMIAEVVIVHGSESISTLIMINVECFTKPIKNCLLTTAFFK